VSIAPAVEIALTAWRSQHAIKPFSIHLAAVVSILVVPLQQAQNDSASFLPWLWVSFLAQIPAHLAVFIMWYFTYRKKQQPAWLIFVIGLLVGSVRGGLVYFLGMQLVPEANELGLVDRLIPASLSWMITIASLALVNYLVFAPNEGWRQLQQELNDLERDLSGSQEQLNWLISRRASGLDRELKRDFVKLSNRVRQQRVNQAEAFAMLAAELRRFAKENVRERSLSIWKGRKTASPLARAAWQSVTNNPLPVAAAVWVYGSGFALSEVRGRDLFEGITLSLTATLLFAMLILITRKLSPERFTGLNLPIIAAVQAWLVVFVLDPAISSQPASDSMLAGFLTAIIWAATSLFGAGWFTVGARLYRTEIPDLRERKSSAAAQLNWLESKLETYNRELAKHLHGVVQSRLMAHAMRLENQGKLGEELDVDQVFAELESILDISGTMHFAEKLDVELELLASRWAGAVELSFAIEPSVDLEKAVAESVQLLQEAITNALKHGEASVAKVQIDDSDGLRSIVVSDNGLRRPEQIAGLGTEIFNSICSGSWSLAHKTKGSTLTCKVRLG